MGVSSITLTILSLFAQNICLKDIYWMTVNKIWVAALYRRTDMVWSWVHGAIWFKINGSEICFFLIIMSPHDLFLQTELRD